MTNEDLRARLAKPRFPRSNTYDPMLVIDNVMGPHVLWLAEYLAEAVPLKPGMRVLDLGCGKAVSSIFFAKEFGVDVVAADLWIKPTENQARIDAAGVADRVTPVHAEAHALPFAEESFDAIVSLDAYQYFGTDDLYLGQIVKFLKPGGRLGIVCLGLAREIVELPDTSQTLLGVGFLLLPRAGLVAPPLGEDRSGDCRRRRLDGGRARTVARLVSRQFCTFCRAFTPNRRPMASRCWRRTQRSSSASSARLRTNGGGRYEQRTHQRALPARLGLRHGLGRRKSDGTECAVARGISGRSRPAPARHARPRPRLRQGDLVDLSCEGVAADVTAADLWIEADGESETHRSKPQAIAGLVMPVHAEAHALPFAEASFDAIVSLDAYHYFGTDDLYLGTIAKFLRPGGRLGIVVPGLAHEIVEVPQSIKPWWEWDFCSFHSPQWWRHHWAKTGLLTVETADRLPDGRAYWLEWCRFTASLIGARGAGATREGDMLERLIRMIFRLHPVGHGCRAKGRQGRASWLAIHRRSLARAETRYQAGRFCRRLQRHRNDYAKLVAPLLAVPMRRSPPGHPRAVAPTSCICS